MAALNYEELNAPRGEAEIAIQILPIESSENQVEPNAARNNNMIENQSNNQGEINSNILDLLNPNSPREINNIENQYIMLLKLGSEGEDVKKLQVKLGVDPIGKFGPKTEAAVKAWQSANGTWAFPSDLETAMDGDDAAGKIAHRAALEPGIF